MGHCKRSSTAGPHCSGHTAVNQKGLLMLGTDNRPAAVRRMDPIPGQDVPNSHGCPCHAIDCALCDTLTLPQFRHKPDLVLKRHYRPKDILCHQGTTAAGLFVLRSGYVKLSTGLPDGRVQGLRLRGAGQLVGIEALGFPHYPYTAEAVTEVSACFFLQKDMLRMLEQSPTLSVKIVSSLGRDLQQINDIICSLGVMTATERVVAFLLMLTPDDARPEQELPLPLTRSDMSEMLGLTVETVSRVLSRLIREKIICAPPGRCYFRVLDKSRLEALSGRALYPPRLTMTK